MFRFERAQGLTGAVTLLRETLPDGHEWLRIADPSWTNPLDPGFAQELGGGGIRHSVFPVLYLNVADGPVSYVA